MLWGNDFPVSGDLVAVLQPGPARKWYLKCPEFMVPFTMPGIRQFEDIKAWQRARLLRLNIRKATRSLAFRRDSDLARQIRRAASSVMSNIAEGFERGTLPELNRFLGIAKGSCGEVRSQLYEALDDGLIATEEFDHLKVLALAASELIGALKSATQKRIRRDR